MNRRAAIVAFAMLAAFALPMTGAHAADTLIQPGAEVISHEGQCTLNFVFKSSAGKQYIGTAGHCSSKIGERMESEDGREFGTVVWRIDNGNDDVSLIEIDSAKYAQTNPSVRNWGGPSGYTTSSSVSPGDEIELYGYGLGFGSLGATRPRYGVLIEADSTAYRAETTAVPGDSGGPLLQASTGKALGIVSHFLNDSGFPGIGPYTDIGPTVERILQLCAAAGYRLSLVTA